MRTLLVSLWKDEVGAILTAELVLIATILLLGIIVGLSEVQAAVVFELNDLSNSIGALNQSYGFTGFAGTSALSGTTKSFVRGSGYRDTVDICDQNEAADLVCGPSSASGEFLPRR